MDKNPQGKAVKVKLELTQTGLNPPVEWPQKEMNRGIPNPQKIRASPSYFKPLSIEQPSWTGGSASIQKEQRPAKMFEAEPRSFDSATLSFSGCGPARMWATSGAASGLKETSTRLAQKVCVCVRLYHMARSQDQHMQSPQVLHG